MADTVTIAKWAFIGTFGLAWLIGVGFALVVFVCMLRLPALIDVEVATTKLLRNRKNAALYPEALTPEGLRIRRLMISSLKGMFLAWSIGVLSYGVIIAAGRFS